MDVQSDLAYFEEILGSFCVKLLGSLLSCNLRFLDFAVSALNSLKEGIYEDPLAVLSAWNTVDSDPCDWSGIGCSETRDHVIKM